MSQASYWHGKPITGPRGVGSWPLLGHYCHGSLLSAATCLAALSLPALPLLPTAALLLLCRLALLPGPGVPSVELASVVRCRRLLGVRFRVRLDPVTPQVMVVYVLRNKG